MKEAIEEARKTMNLNYGGPFGAMITKDNKIIAIASNTVLKDNDPTAHAEINAIRKAGEVLNTHDLSGCILYATGYPCPMCLSAIIWSNIKEKNKDILQLKNLDHEECLELFKEYQEQKKEMY